MGAVLRTTCHVRPSRWRSWALRQPADVAGPGPARSARPGAAGRPVAPAGPLAPSRRRGRARSRLVSPLICWCPCSMRSVSASPSALGAFRTAGHRTASSANAWLNTRRLTLFRTASCSDPAVASSRCSSSSSSMWSRRRRVRTLDRPRSSSLCSARDLNCRCHKWVGCPASCGLHAEGSRFPLGQCRSALSRRACRRRVVVHGAVLGAVASERGDDRLT